MSITVKLKILGEPMGKQRPKASVFGGHAHIYTPSKTHNYESLVKDAYIKAYGDSTPPTTKPLKVNLVFYFGLSKSDYGKKGLNKSGRGKMDGTIKCTKKPDIDNAIKIILDGLNGLAFHDDSQIVDLRACKSYSETPRVEIGIYELGEE